MKPPNTALRLALILALVPVAAGAQTITVTDEAQLRLAIATAPDGATIVFGASITLTADLPAVASNITLDGGGHTLSGNSLYRGFVVGNLSDGPLSVNVTVQNITIANTVALGGAGGTGSAGGGGGAGLGGALFVAEQASVTISNVSITGSSAIGGSGGAVDTSATGGGGGGGLGGDGGSGSVGSGGGGGGAGAGATGGTSSTGGAGSPGILTGAGSGGDSGSIPGGVNGGGGAASGQGAGGGGAFGGGGFSGTAGFGGYGGGGGGGVGSSDGGQGSLGGGGGGNNGSGFGFGGFGGGGGGNTGGPGTVSGGFGGGSGGGSAAPGGGGGAGMGGGIFVDAGGSISIGGGVSINGNTVGAGSGSGAGGSGSAWGSGMFFAGGGTITVNTGAGEVTTIADSFGDEFGYSGIIDTSTRILNKTGAGTLVLTGDNKYAGGTVIDAGTLQINAAGALGTGDIGIDDGAKLSITGSTTIARQIFVNGSTAIDAGIGQTVALNGAIQDGSGRLSIPGAIAFGGGGTVSLGNATNSYSGGTSILGNTTVVIGADGALGLAGTAVTLGDAVTGGTLSFGTGTSFSTNRAVAITTGGGTINTAGSADILMSGALSGSGPFTKSGTGTLTLAGSNTLTRTLVADGTLRAGNFGALGNGAIQVGTPGTLDLNGYSHLFGSLAGAGRVTLGTATLGVGSDNTSTTYAGDISGSGGLFKTGSGTLTLTGTNTYFGGTFVSSGTLSGTTLGIQGTIQNFGTVEFNQAGNGTYSGVMSGFGSLVKSGTGTVTLTGANTYGGGTTVNGGVLAGDTTSLQGNFLNNAVVQFNQPGNGSFTGIMTGTGRLVKSGTGTLTLTGAHTYSGGTLISGGTLAGDTTSIQGTIQNDANLLFNQNANGTFSGTVFGTGSVTKAGSGTLTLAGTSSYTGGTTISAGLLIGSTQSLQGNIVNNAFLRFDQLFNGAFTGDISGSGALSKSGAGIVTLSGTNTYTGGTSVLAGGLMGTTSSLQGNISNSGQVIFNQNTNGSYTGTLIGTGALFKEGTGIVTLTGPNTYSGGTFVNGGTLSGNTTSLQGPIVNNATVEFNQATNAAYGSIMSGSGTLVKSGTGTLTLTGANTYSGGTVITGGTLAGDASTIQGNIQNNASLVFNQNTNGIFSGVMFGTGTLTKNGTGTLTLTGQSAYTGGTTITAGTLAGNTNSLQGNILNNAFLRFDQLFDGIFNGDLSGTGHLTKSGPGTVILNGTSSYTGGTTIASGGLMGTSASLRGNIFNNGQVIFSQNTNGTFTGAVSGTGSFVKTGTGILTLAGANTYTGGTFIAGGGGVSISSDASLGSNGSGVALGDATSFGSITFTNGGLLQSVRAFALGAGGGVFDTAGALVSLAGGLSGAGGLTKNGSGVLELAGSSSYAGPTIVNAGTLRTATSGALGQGALLLSNGALVDLNGFNQTVGSIGGSGSLLLGNATLTTGGDGSSSLFSGLISGSGSLVKTGGGTLALTAANTYTGGTRVLGGALVGTTTSLQGNIFNDSVVLFDQNNNGTYAGVLSGSGVLAKGGSGVLTLTGNNTYTGGTVITGGSISANANSLRGPIVNNASLTFGGASDGVFFGSISGSGSLLKVGTGALSLTGAQPLSGLFTIQEGTVALNGSYGGSMNILAGAALRANGFIAGSVNLAGSLFAVSPGTAFAPSGLVASGLSAATGDSLEGPSYLTIGQNLTATPGSRLNFAIGPGSNPTVLVGGTASLNGARFDVTAPAIGNARSTSFLALAALNGLSLQNTDVVTGDTGVLPSLTQDRNSLFVTLLNLNVPLASVARTPVAEALDRSKFGGDSDARFVIKELTALDDERLKDALEQLAGELHASVLHTAIIDSETITDLIRDQLSARQLDDREDFRWWGETACQRADFEGSDKARPGHANICAGAGGVDRRLSEKWTVGGGGSFTGGNMGVDGGGGKGDYQAPRAFGYAGFKPNRFGFRGGGSAAKSNYKTKRQINFDAYLPPELGGQPISQGVHREAEAEQDGSSADGWSEISDTRKFAGYTLESMLGVRRARIARAAFTEDGAISIDLAGQDEILNLTQTDLKVHFFRSTGNWRPFVDFFYRRELADGETEAQVKFEGLPQSDFIVEGINIPANTYSTKVGLAFATWLGQATFTYEYRKAPGQQRQTAGFRIRFK